MISLHLCMTQKHNFQHAPADHPLFLALARIAESRNVVIDLHMEAVPEATATPPGLKRVCSANPEALPPSIPPLERLLSAHRGARVVWQHVGWDNVGAMTPALLQGLLERHSNLFLGLRVEARTSRLGGGGAMPNRILDENLKLQAAWRTFITRYADRLVVGSDDFISPDDRLALTRAHAAHAVAQVHAVDAARALRIVSCSGKTCSPYKSWCRQL